MKRMQVQLLFLTGTIWLLVGHLPVLAHANLVRSQPAAGQVLTEAPSQMRFEFSEVLDPAFVRLTLLDGQGQTVAADGAVLDAADPAIAHWPLPPLPPGSYSAVWRVRSAVDGHITTGTVAFAVGESGTAVSRLPPPGVPDPVAERPPLWDTVWRWLNYAATAVAGGAAFFVLWVWRPAWRRWPEPDKATDGRATRLFCRVMQGGAVALMAVTAGFLLAQASLATERPSTWSSTFLMLLVGRTGLLLSARFALALLLFWLARRLPPAGNGPARPWLLAAAIGLALALTFSLQSHSAALGGGITLIGSLIDWAHTTAMIVWVGGLVLLLTLLTSEKSARTLWPLLLPCFSRLALAAVLALAVSGGGLGLLHVRTGEALMTTYGHALSLKTAVFALMVALGAVNLLFLTPRLKRSGAAAGFRRTIPAELLFAGLVLLAAAVMTGVAPAWDAWQAQQRLGYTETAVFRDARLTLRIAPAQIGENEFAVDVIDNRADADAAEPMVILRFQPAEIALGITQVDTTAAGAGRFTAHGSYLSLAGEWHITVILRRIGFDDVSHMFHIQLE